MLHVDNLVFIRNVNAYSGGMRPEHETQTQLQWMEILNGNSGRLDGLRVL